MSYFAVFRRSRYASHTGAPRPLVTRKRYVAFTMRASLSAPRQIGAITADATSALSNRATNRLERDGIRPAAFRKAYRTCECRELAETAEIGMSPVDSATARDVPHTRLRAIVATPSGSTAMGWTPPPDIAGIDVPKWECHQPLESRGASR